MTETAKWVWSGTSFRGKLVLTYQAKELWPLVVSRCDETASGGAKFDTVDRRWRIFFDRNEIPTGKSYGTARDAQIAAQRLFEAIIPGLARMTTSTIKLFGCEHDVR